MFNSLRILHRTLALTFHRSDVLMRNQLQKKSCIFLHTSRVVYPATARNSRSFQSKSKTFLPLLPPSLKSMYAQRTKHTQEPVSHSTAQSIKLKRYCPEIVQESLKGFFLTCLMEYLRKYYIILIKSFPAIIKLYRSFTNGVSDFYNDLKWYWKILHIVHSSPDGLRSLNSKELEFYMQMPRDMIKVTPTIIGTSLPIVGYVFFALAFMFPRQLLSSHFWSPMQRDQFRQIELNKRFSYYKSIIRKLYELLKIAKEPLEYGQLAKILAFVGHSQFCPSTAELLRLKDIFAKPPYSLQSLKKDHIKLLINMNGLPRLSSKRRVKLQRHAVLIQHTDTAIKREGGVHNLPFEALERACAIRGLNPVSLTHIDMVHWLTKWVSVTTSIEDEHLSLLLHLPIFLGFNHPNNWKLCAN